MRYLGSKNRIAKHLLPVILPHRREGQWWVEPFVGGANMIDKVEGKRLGNDNNEYVIALFKALQRGWIPPGDLSEDQYRTIRDNKENFPPELVCFAGILCSFGGRWFEGYARSADKANYAARGQRALMKQLKNIRGVYFTSYDYRIMPIPDNSLIYCDPPYRGTKSYKNDFNNDDFWKWCREVGRRHKIFISEYTAPEDFKCIKTVEIGSPMRKPANRKEKSLEKLFVYEESQNKL
jgi:DNA adenine methylase